MLRAGSWSRSNSFWGTSQFKPPNGTLGARSEFDQQSMIALGSSRTLDGAEPVVEGLPTIRPEHDSYVCFPSFKGPRWLCFSVNSGLSGSPPRGCPIQVVIASQWHPFSQVKVAAGGDWVLLLTHIRYGNFAAAEHLELIFVHDDDGVGINPDTQQLRMRCDYWLHITFAMTF